MTDLELKLGQIESDKQDLQDDLDSGLFKQRPQDFWQRSCKLNDRIIDYWKTAYQIREEIWQKGSQ